MRVEVALVSVVDRLTDTVRKMDIGGGHPHPAIVVDDSHDALQRMFRLALRAARD